MIPDVQIVFTVNGAEKRLHYRKLPFFVWEELKGQHGWTPQTLISALAEGDIVAGAVVVWLERKQREKRLKWAEVRREFEDTDIELEFTDLLVDGRSQYGTDATAESDEDPTGGSS